MLSRRNFLKGLLATVATGALVKNGIVQPERVIAEPKRRVFDMAQNTWRSGNGWHFLAGRLNELPPLRGFWPIVGGDGWTYWHEVHSPVYEPKTLEWAATLQTEWATAEPLNCRCIPGYSVGDPITAKWDQFEAVGHISQVSFEENGAVLRFSIDHVDLVPNVT
jgi:hypothetical protein